MNASQIHGELSERETAEGVREAARMLAEQMARSHYQEMYGDNPLCSACADGTPRTDPWGPFINLTREYHELEEHVAEYVESTDADVEGVLADMGGAYFRAFETAAVSPERCEVCTDDELGGEVDACGHDRYGARCPA